MIFACAHVCMCVEGKGELWVLFLRGLAPVLETGFPTGLELCTLGWWVTAPVSASPVLGSHECHHTWLF